MLLPDWSTQHLSASHTLEHKTKQQIFFKGTKKTKDYRPNLLFNRQNVNFKQPWSQGEEAMQRTFWKKNKTKKNNSSFLTSLRDWAREAFLTWREQRRPLVKSHTDVDRVPGRPAVKKVYIAICHSPPNPPLSLYGSGSAVKPMSWQGHEIQYRVIGPLPRLASL